MPDQRAPPCARHAYCAFTWLCLHRAPVQPRCGATPRAHRRRQSCRSCLASRSYPPSPVGVAPLTGLAVHISLVCVVHAVCIVAVACSHLSAAAAAAAADSLVAACPCHLPPLVCPAATKLLWLKRREPQNWERLAHWLLPHDYVNFWLTGRLCMEVRMRGGEGWGGDWRGVGWVEEG